MPPPTKEKLDNVLIQADIQNIEEFLDSKLLPLLSVLPNITSGNHTAMDIYSILNTGIIDLHNLVAEKLYTDKQVK